MIIKDYLNFNSPQNILKLRPRCAATRRAVYGLLFLSGLLSHAAHAFEFISLDKPAILYDAPSQMAKKRFVGTRYLPLEQIVSVDGWSKVRDSSGALFWVEKNAVTAQRFVLITVPFATIRSAADSTAPIVFYAQQNVALARLEATGTGWVKIKHLDGATGYVNITEVWGE